MSKDLEMKDADTEVDSDDGWGVHFVTDEKKWGDRTGGEKCTFLSVLLAKILLIVAALYFFICDLSFLASGFRLVAGRQAGEIFQNSEVFNNPIAGSARPRAHSELDAESVVPRTD